MRVFIEMIHKKWVVTSLAILYWPVAIYLIYFIAELQRSQLVEHEKETVAYEVSEVRSRIESLIFMNTYIADSLVTVITITPDYALKNWETVAGKLVNKSHLVRNVGFAPNNIISYVYPLEGNERALGVDFETRPDQYRSVLEAERTKSVYLDGPLELIQGGQALIARFPIFHDYPHNNIYWGSVSVVFNYDDIVSISRLREVKGAEIALQRQYPDRIETFYGSDSIFRNPDFILPVRLPNTEWQLAVKYNFDHQPLYSEQQVTYFFGGLGSVTLFMSLFFVIRASSIARKASFVDELTGLWNRRYLFQQLEKATVLSPRPCSVLNIDLNKFKQINDTLGHAAGDKVLITVADMLKQLINNQGVVSRLGGDEFIVLLFTPSQTENITNKIHSRAAQLTVSWEETEIPISLSVGFSIFKPGSGISYDELMHHADQNMYINKSLG